MEHSHSSTIWFAFCFVLCYLVPVMECSTPIITTRRKVPTRHNLTLDFYSKTCPQLDHLVLSVTSKQFSDVPVSSPSTIRLFFHDCFVEGCDASVLLASGQDGLVERNVGDNRNLALEGFDTINKAKAMVESKCPGVVSCADILAIAARDFVHLTIFGAKLSDFYVSIPEKHVELTLPQTAGGPYYEVKKGRRDSKLSSPNKVKSNLPTSNSTIDDLLTLFGRKGLSQRDLVALSGAHTIGFSHCAHFVTRLYNFHGTNGPDPSIDPRLLKALKMSCPMTGGNEDVVAPFDVSTPFEFDHMYYGNLEAKMGLLATDQALWLDPRTRPLVEGLGKDKGKFFKAFAEGMEKMGAIGVKKGKKGEVRKVCYRRN